jgi:predicted transcriptional regulator
MTALTVRIPDEKYQRLKLLAKQRQTSVNRLFDEMATLMLAEHDAETRFIVRAERGKGQQERGLELLEKAKGG